MSTTAISLQAYSVQSELARDLRGTLSRLSEAGFTRLEPGFHEFNGEVRSALEQFGFDAPTMHVPFTSTQLRTPDGTVIEVPELGDAFHVMARAGVRLAVDPYVAVEEWNTEESVAAIAARINVRAAEAAAVGLQVAYHNHAHEISSRIGGRTALEVLADHLDPAVALEVDLFWAAYGGADVAKLVTDLGSRVIAVHVKDGSLKQGVPLAQTPAGLGEVPLTEALDAATHLEYAIIEFDHPYDGDVVDASIRSRDFLIERGYL